MKDPSNKTRLSPGIEIILSCLARGKKVCYVEFKSALRNEDDFCVRHVPVTAQKLLRATLRCVFVFPICVRQLYTFKRMAKVSPSEGTTKQEAIRTIKLAIFADNYFEK